MNKKSSAVEEKTYLSPAEAALYMGVSKSFLNKARTYGNVLIKYSKVGRRVLYRRCDLDDYIAQTSRVHTGSKAGAQ